MLQGLFHAWERRLAFATKDRVVRPFEWGLDWLTRPQPPAASPARLIGEWVADVMANTDAFFTPPPTTAYTLGAGLEDGEQLLTFPSAFDTPHPENNTVYGRVFRAKENPDRAHRAAVLVLPQWNSDTGGHVGL